MKTGRAYVTLKFKGTDQSLRVDFDPYPHIVKFIEENELDSIELEIESVVETPVYLKRRCAA